jgi:hypothetical protein
MSARTLSVRRESAGAGIATAAIMAGTLPAHTWAGGHLPSLPWLGLLSLLVLGATRAVFRGQTSARFMVVGLGAAQLLLHVLLTVTAARPTHHGVGSHDALAADASRFPGLEVLLISWQMAAAHLLSALLTAAVWSATARALADLLLVPDQAHLPVRARRAGPAAGPGAVVRTVSGWLSGAPRRGPPVVPTPQVS